MSSDGVSTPGSANAQYLLRYIHRDGCSVPDWEECVMRLSSSLVAPSAVTILSTALLCSFSGTAVSQTNSAAPLPSITIEAPKQVARPHGPKQVANAVASRRTSPAAETRSSTAQTSSAGPDTVLGKLAKLEKASSSCNGGCETSIRHGDVPWVGCSSSGGENSVSAFSSTCRDTLTYRTYSECTSTKIFLGWIPREARWHCSSLLVAGKLAGEKHEVAELKRPGAR